MDTVVVTSENYAEFVAKKLDLASPKNPEKDVEGVAKGNDVEKLVPENDGEKKAEQEQEKKEQSEKESAEDVDHDDTEDKPKKKKSPISERFSELSAQRRAAQERAEAAEARAKANEDRIKQLEEKLNGKQEPAGKPKPDDFKDAFTYAEALASWTAKEAIAQDREQRKQEDDKRAQQQIAQEWNKKIMKAQLEMPDYKEVISASDVTLSDPVRDAILESDAGPKILYHFAQHPEEAERLNELSPRKALLELGKIEDRLIKPKKSSLSDISGAPAPINPVRGGGTPNPTLDGKGEFKGSYAEYKEMRRAGKIK